MSTLLFRHSGTGRVGSEAYLVSMHQYRKLYAQHGRETTVGIRSGAAGRVTGSPYHTRSTVRVLYGS